MNCCEIVVLSKFPEIFEGFRECVDRDAPELRKHVVWDTASKIVISPLPDPWDEAWPENSFQMAAYGNIGIRQGLPSDILYCGDDTRITESDTIKRLREVAYSESQAFGIVSANIIGTCAKEEIFPVDRPVTPLFFVGFVFVYIKREVIDAIGYLDERFEGYGFEDLDYCYRARKAGFMIGMARDIHVKHGVEGHTYGSTFIRTTGEQEMAKQDAANRKRFAEKWGIENDPVKIFEFIRKG